MTAGMAGRRPSGDRNGDLRVNALSVRRRWSHRLFTAGAHLAVAAAFIPLLLVMGYVLVRGAGIISPAFFTADIPAPQTAGPGMAPAVYGTIMITGLATLIAVPVGVAAAVYLAEYGKRSRLATMIRFLSDVMTGVPSIVMGLFVYVTVVLTIGQMGIAGSLALAALMLPIIIRSSEEALLLVPDDLRAASSALGADQSWTIVRAVLPAALPGIVTGSMLAIARAAGETAPLLFTIGAVRVLNPSLVDGTTTALSAQIFSNATQPYLGAQNRAWGAALTLIVIVLLFSIGARIVTDRFTAHRQ